VLVLDGGLYERRSGAAGQPLGSYQRRAPERTVLHELVARHAVSMLAEVRDADPDGGGLPRYVERELAAYVRCGQLAHGFARVRCGACGDEIVVAFSCKRRRIWPVVHGASLFLAAGAPVEHGCSGRDYFTHRIGFRKSVGMAPVVALTIADLPSAETVG
jgi:hypothetical protein